MSEKFWLVVQYPLKSAKGSQRDQWLKEKVTECLGISLANADLGYVDGSTWGGVFPPPKSMRLIYFV